MTSLFDVNKEEYAHLLTLEIEHRASDYHLLSTIREDRPASGQKGISPLASGQKGISPMATGQKGISPIAIGQKGIMFKTCFLKRGQCILSLC